MSTEISGGAVVEMVSQLMHMPGIKVNRESFLLETLSIPANRRDDLLKYGPIASGLFTQEDIMGYAEKISSKRTWTSTGISFAAGLPGGFTMAATIPADIIQFFGVNIRLAQEIAYLYGHKDFWQDGDLDMDAVNGEMMLFLGTMLGAGGAASLMRYLSAEFSKYLATNLAKKSLNKTLWYPVVKSLAKYIGVKLTKDSTARVFSKAVPVLGGVTSAGITYFAMKSMSERLYLAFDKAVDYTDEEKNEDILEIRRNMPDVSDVLFRDVTGDAEENVEPEGRLRYNALVIGKSGVGKSSFINYLFGWKAAESGAGKPVTKRGVHKNETEIDGVQYNIYDSWGLEADKVQEWIERLNTELKNHDVSKSPADWFHTVFYVVNAGNHRIEDMDIAVIKRLRSEKYCVGVVLNKCDLISEEDEIALKKVLWDNIDPGLSIMAVSSGGSDRNGEKKPFGKEAVKNKMSSDFLKTIAERLPAHLKIISKNMLDEFLDGEKARVGGLGTLESKEAAVRQINRSMEDLFKKIQAQIKNRCKEALSLHASLTDNIFGDGDCAGYLISYRDKGIFSTIYDALTNPLSFFDKFGDFFSEKEEISSKLEGSVKKMEEKINDDINKIDEKLRRKIRELDPVGAVESRLPH